MNSPDTTPAEATTILSKGAPSILIQSHLHIPTTNQLSEENGLWGDNITYKNKNTSRILFNNVNGIPFDKGNGKSHSIGHNMNQLDVDIAGLAETNLDWSRHEATTNFSAIIRQHHRISKCSFCSSSSTFTHAYQPGGTATVVANKWAGCATPGHDTTGLGRWTEFTLKGTRRQVTIITAYRPCSNNHNSTSTLSTYSQQWKLLRDSGNETPDPRQQMLDDLHGRIKHIREEKGEVILMIDANESNDSRYQKWSNWVQSVELTDPLLRRHGTEHEPPTTKGSSRIDFILASSGIEPFIQRGGILPYDEFVHSDHRPIYIDVDMRSFLGGNMKSPTNFEPRRLVSTDKRKTAIYLGSLRDLLDKSDIETRMTSLITTLETTGMNEVNSIEFDKIDQSLSKIRLQAEENIPKRPSLEWSPRLRDSWYRVIVWKIALSQLTKGRHLKKNKLKRHLAKVCPESIPNDKAAINRELRQARKIYRDNVAEAVTLRRQHLASQLTAAIDKSDPAAEKAIIHIKKAEKKKRIFKKLERILKPTRNGAMESVLIPSVSEVEQGQPFTRKQTWARVVDATEIQRTLIERNQKHFGQALLTPFASEHLTSIFHDGSNAASTRLMRGEILVEEISQSEATRSILRKLRQIIPANSIPIAISIDEVKNKYRVWKESTSTAPSGLHLGHAKTLLTATEEIDCDLSDRVFTLMTQIINIAFEYKTPPSRWKHIVTCMLEKIPGMPYITKLRAIHLLENDFNSATGIYTGKKMIQECEVRGLLGEEQFGSRKDRSSTEVLLTKHISYAIIRVTKTNATTFDNDLKSCYDRIVLLAAALRMRSLGVDPRVMTTMIRTFNSAEYKIKTAHGISDLSYSHSILDPLFGTPQGAISSPPIWTVQWKLQADCMRERSRGMTFHDPQRNLTANLTLSAIVDDTTNYNNDFLNDLRDNTDESRLLRDTGTAAQWWEQLTNVTGGKLELSKCFYYRIFWDFDDEGVSTIRSTPKDHSDISIQDSETLQHYNIEELDCATAHKTLGTMEGPHHECYKEEHTRLLSKAKSIATLIGTASLNRDEATTLYNSCLIASLRYSLPIGTMSLSDAVKIQSRPVAKVVGFMGFPWSMPHAALYGPSDLGGGGLTHLFALQGAAKVKAVLQQLRSDRTLGNLLRIYLSWTQIAVGTSKPILEDTKPMCLLKSERWLETLREFLHKSNLSIGLDSPAPDPPRREHDLFLMDIATEAEWTQGEIEKINRCRIYIRAIYLSDVCTADGRAITSNAMKCIREPGLWGHDWPRQTKPGDIHKRVWRTFLLRLCRVGIEYSGTRKQTRWDEYHKLSTPMGRWTSPPCNSRMHMVGRSKTLYKKADNGWHGHRHLRTYHIAYGVYTLLPTSQHDVIPEDATFAECNPTEQNLIAKSSPWRSTEKASPTIPTGWQQFVSTRPPWTQPLLRHTPKEDVIRIRDHLSANRATTVVSDGSNPGHIGSYGWVAGTDTSVIGTGNGRAWGGPMTAYRAEGFGILAWIVNITCIIDFYNITYTAPISAYCDNESMVSKSNDVTGTLKETIQADYDIILQIRSSISQLRQSTTVVIRHVKGHQDDHFAFDDLSRPAQLNVLADKAADNAIEFPVQEFSFTEEIAHLKSDGVRICNGEIARAERQWAERRFITYIEKRLDLHSSGIHLIDWQSVSWARKQTQQSVRVFHTKLISGWVATRYQRHKYGDCSQECTLCGAIETFDHIIQCHRQHKWRESFIDRLNTKLKSLGTAADIRTSLCEGIKSWMNKSPPHAPQTKAAKTCTDAQEATGWRLWIRGYPHIEWCRHQCEFSKTSMESDTWHCAVIRWVMEEMQQLWSSHWARECDESDGPSDYRSDLIKQITEMYDQQHEIAEQDRVLFGTQLEILVKKPTQQLQQWIQSNRPLFRKLRRQHIQRTINNQHDIRDFLAKP